ncbi:MAG: MgtC/SapB family protein [Armatimonadota bacterium]|nr:MgtC/SapB family protein [Armatimonadota bacterium]
MDYAQLAELFKIFAVSLLLGAFIGLERERGERRPLGIRSFMLVSATATVAALIAEQTDQVWVLPAAFLALGALLVIGHLGYLEEGRRGLTTELAALMTFGLGIIVYTGPMELAIALGVVTAAVLHFKPQLHDLADRTRGEDIYAMVQFGLVAFVVLPVLPNRNFGPYDVLNPYHIWLMVVLVSGINLAGYVSLKYVDGRHGGVVSGLLGGLASSTATTFSFSKRARDAADFVYPAGLAIIVATAVTAPRMAVLIGVVNSDFLVRAWLPLTFMFLASLAPFAWLWLRGGGSPSSEPPEVKNPAEVRAAIIFGVLYALVSLALAAAQQHFSDAGTYTVSALSGLTGVDAITLSTARLAGVDRIASAQAIDVIVIAYISNLVAKGALAAIVGTTELARMILLAFGFTFLAGLAVILLV